MASCGRRWRGRNRPADGSSSGSDSGSGSSGSNGDGGSRGERWAWVLAGTKEPNANAAGPTSCFERRTRIKDIARERSITHEVAKDQSAGGRDHAPRFSRNAISRALSLSLRSLLFYLSLISSAIIISLSLCQVLLNLNLNSIPPFRFSQPERLHEA